MGGALVSGWGCWDLGKWVGLVAEMAWYSHTVILFHDVGTGLRDGE